MLSHLPTLLGTVVAEVLRVKLAPPEYRLEVGKVRMAVHLT